MFRFFRRYQKSFIVVGGVILMFVFLVGDYIGSSRNDPTGGNQISPNATFATWKGGSLTHGEFDTEYNKRRILSVFLQTVYAMGEQRAMSRGLEIPMLTVQPIGFLNEREGRPIDDVRREVLLDKILADEARRRGMGVSKETLESYIAKLGFSELSSDDLRAALASLRATVSSDYILSALEDAFLAHIMRGVYGTSAAEMLATEMPLDRWRSWRQVNDLTSVEAAAVKVEEFTSEVPAPTEQQLRELYNEFKDATPRPDVVGGVRLPSPRPAFAVPRKVKLQYLQSDFNGVVEKFKAEVTDEEVKKYYEENKGLFRKASPLDLFGPFPEAEEEGASEGAPSDGEAPATSPEEEGTTAPSADPPTNDTPTEAPTAEETPGESTSPEGTTEEPSAEPTPSTEPEGDAPAGDTPAENEPAGEQPSSDEPAPEPQAQRGDADNFQFVSYQPEGGETPSAEEQPAPADEPATGENEGAAEDQPAEGEGDPAESDDPAGEEGAPAGETPAAETPEGETPENQPAADQKPEEEFSPLEEVADQIREQIARARAEEKLAPALDAAMERLQISARDYRRKVLALPEDAPRPAPPEELADLSKLAAEFNLVYEETEPVDYFELLDTSIGKAVDDQFQPVVRLVFSESTTDLYRPFSAMSMTPESFGNRYIVMKIADTPERIPPYDEVKSLVREAWIRREAAKLALKRAEEFATKASEAGQSLKEFFAGNEKVEVTETPAFSWYTQSEAASPDQGPNYKMSQPFGVTNVGRDFMETVFNLRGNDVKAVLNHDETIAYVVRIASEIESEESLRSTFLANANAWEGRLTFRQAMLQDRQIAIASTLEEELDIETPGIEELRKLREQED